MDLWGRGVGGAVYSRQELTVAVLGGCSQAVTKSYPTHAFLIGEVKGKDTRTELVLPAQISKDVYAKALIMLERV